MSRFPFDAAIALCHHSGPERFDISFRISILASGSSGNSTLLETERTTLLIDAGLGRREIARRFEALGRALPERVDAILITHEHTDHSSAAAQLARHWDCPAYLTEPTHREIIKMYAEEPGKPGPKATLDRVEYIRAGERFQIGDIEVNPFRIPHDAADPVAFSFRTNLPAGQAGGTKVAIATDLGYMPELVKQHLREADFLILESNHDLEMLKVGPYPWHIKQRVMSRTGHLSNNIVSDFLADSEVFDARARHLVLAHLSEQNNTPEIAQISAEQALAARAADFAFRGSLHIASQRIPLGPFEL
ncbi:MAG TPA: MBL fold metallo-hydrolase [Candidatus Acidoferrales bacterium]|nr:MBL fold metallo-hydrolase [Candidatus Acidoferrales bacterium]